MSRGMPRAEAASRAGSRCRISGVAVRRRVVAYVAEPVRNRENPQQGAMRAGRLHLTPLICHHRRPWDTMAGMLEGLQFSRHRGAMEC